MDKDGFYPIHNCKRCNKPLQGQGSGRPAELYAGTYTGLCYPCTNAPMIILRQYPDGAQRKEYSPYRPSYRRNRNSYIAYDDCDDCKGLGYTYRYQRHGSYRAYCDTCSRRFYKHPIRQAYESHYNRLRDRFVSWYDTSVYIALLKAGYDFRFGRPKGLKIRRKKGAIVYKTYDEVPEDILNRWFRIARVLDIGAQLRTIQSRVFRRIPESREFIQGSSPANSDENIDN